MASGHETLCESLLCVQDPQIVLREKCRNDAHCQSLKAELQRCSDRVNSKKKTTETCAQEFYDFMHCVDHCVSTSRCKRTGTFSAIEFIYALA